MAVLILGAFAALPAGAAASTPQRAAAGASPAAAVAAVPATPTSLVSAAVSSLNQGAGPAHGSPAGCALAASGQASCGATPVRASGISDARRAGAAPRSVPVAGAPEWYNVASNISAASSGTIPSIEFGGRMAYDPILSEVVLFDDCSLTQCPGNATWTYNGLTWTNITGSLATAPSAREGPGMDYDPSFHGVILFGGTSVAGINLNDTWLFTATGWANITGTVGQPLATGTGYVNWAYGAMAFDPALDLMFVVDGCLNATCTSIWGQTFFLSATGWSWNWGPGTLTNGTYLAYSSLAYDAALGTMVEFGGYDALSAHTLNLTFTFNATTDTWTNITNHDAGCVTGTCYTPAGRDSAAMTWDGQLNAVLLTDGYEYPAVVWLNDSWLFSNGGWYPTNLTAANPPSTYCPAAQPALQEMSDNVAPFVLGGSSPSCGAATFTSEFVFEVAPHPTLTAHAVELGAATTFTYGWTAGTGSGIVAGWNVTFGDSHTSNVARATTGANTSAAYTGTVTHTYGASGTFSANVTWKDFYYVTGALTGVSVTVYPALAATITASSLSISAGGAVTFSTSPTGGSGVYTYAWQFGDGATSTVQGPPAHTYAKAGSYVVNLTVTDSTGHAVMSSITIKVTASSSGPGLNLGGTTGYILIGVVVAVLAILAALLLMRRRRQPAAAPTAWQPTAPPPGGAGTPPPGAVGGPPPGAGGPPPPPPA